MKLKVKDVDIASGGAFIVILNQEDARKLDLHHGDRVKVKKGKKEAIAVLDVAESKKTVPPGKIGLFEEVLDKLGAKDKDAVYLYLAEKPISVSYIKKKLEGETLTEKEINKIVKSIVNNELNTIELSYFVAGAYSSGMNINETISLTKAIVRYGDILRLNKYPVLDKHCSGGVPGNRTTMIIVPIIAAAGFVIPKTSSRAITSPAGTADTVEVLTPVDIPVNKMKAIVKKTNGCLVWGGAMNLAAADDRLIKVRNPLSLDPRGMLLSSIIAKKAAVNATHILIDIPVGRRTKITSRKTALSLKRDFVKIFNKIGMKGKVIITNGTQPIGNGIGPALEARDVLWVLKGDKRGPEDLRKKSIWMSGLLLEMVGVKNARKKAEAILNNGLAYKKLKQIIKEQGGKPNIRPGNIKIGKCKFVVRSKKNGKVKEFNNRSISRIARVAGAPVDKGAGIYLEKHIGDKVKKGEKLFTIYSENRDKLRYAVKILKEFGGVEVGR